MTRTANNPSRTERLYALLAYTSAMTIMILGGYVILRTASDARVAAL